MLDSLFHAALTDSNHRKESISTSLLEEQILCLAPTIDVYEALKPASNIKLIAEIKRKSPSKGFLAEIPDAGDQASKYELFGASAISVLTEGSGFGGSLEDLRTARSAAAIPLLRKDFIQNEYQILEARAAGADFILLIVTWLDPELYARLSSFAHSIGLGVLSETHSEAEIEIAASIGAGLIGINTRDLETFEVDISLFEKMAGLLPQTTIKVAESSVKTVVDVQRYRNSGADCVLIGEALVTGDPAVLIPEFISVT